MLESKQAVIGFDLFERSRLEEWVPWIVPKIGGEEATKLLRVVARRNLKPSSCKCCCKVRKTPGRQVVACAPSPSRKGVGVGGRERLSKIVCEGEGGHGKLDRHRF